MGVFTKLLPTQNKTPQELTSLAFIESPIPSAIVSDSGVIVDVNYSFAQMMGYEREEILGERMSLFKSGEHNDAFYKDMWGRLLSAGRHDLELYNRTKNDTIILVRQKITQITNGAKRYFITTQEDITEEKKLYERNNYLATHDPLTGLANRALFDDRFTHSILNAVRTSKKMGLLMCDLNEFKSINDSQGHSFGDKVLQACAKKLQESVRKSDTVARYGGDEFTIVLEHIESYSEVKEKMMEILSHFPLKVSERGLECDITMSIGYAVFPEDGLSSEQLFRIADMKMYDAKDNYYWKH